MVLQARVVARRRTQTGHWKSSHERADGGAIDTASISARVTARARSGALKKGAARRVAIASTGGGGVGDSLVPPLRLFHFLTAFTTAV